MNGHSNGRLPRTFDELADALDLSAAISAALASRPIDEDALRGCVWTFVSTQRHAGISPGHVIIAVTDIIDAACIGPISVRRNLTRRVVVWCVEAYFGHLGGDVFGGEPGVLVGVATPAWNR